MMARQHRLGDDNLGQLGFEPTAREVDGDGVGEKSSSSVSVTILPTTLIAPICPLHILHNAKRSVAPAGQIV